MLNVCILIISATFLVALNAHPFNPNETPESSSEVKETPNLQSESQQVKNNSNDSAQGYVQESYIQILLPGIPLLNTTQLESLLNITTNHTNTESSEETVSPLQKDPNVRETRDIYNQDGKESSEEKNDQPSDRSPLQTASNVRKTPDTLKQDGNESPEEKNESSSSEDSSEKSPLQTAPNVRETRDTLKEDSNEPSEEKNGCSASKGSKISNSPLQQRPNVRETRDVYNHDSKESLEEKNDSSSSEESSAKSEPSEKSPLQTASNDREIRDAYKQESQKSSEEITDTSSSEKSSKNSNPFEKSPASSLNENVDSPPVASTQNHWQKKTSNQQDSYGSTGVTPDQPLLGRDARGVTDSVEESSLGSTEKEPVIFVTPQNKASTDFQTNLKESSSSSSSVRGGESLKTTLTE